MRMVKKIGSVTLLILLILLYNSCERRPLEDGYKETMALIPVSIDWSKSGIPINADGKIEIHRATILLYPKGGEVPLEYLLEGDITQREIEVPVGTYSVIIFNETTDADDWTNIYFEGIGQYETFAAYTKPDVQKGFYKRAEENTLCMQPNPLAAWSLDNFEVTTDMVSETRSGLNSRKIISSGARALTGVKPLPRSKRVEVKVRVINLASAVQATGIVKGVVTGVMMASGAPVNELASHAILLNGRQMEENGKDGQIGAAMYIFGINPNETASFQTDFVLSDGTLYTPPKILDENLFKLTEEEDNFDYLIDVGIGTSTIPTPDNPNPDPDIPPIALPESEANSDVMVGDWDEIIIPLI